MPSTSPAPSTSSSAGSSHTGIKVVLDVTVWLENRGTCMLKSKTSKMALSVCILTLISDGGFVDFRRMPIWRFDREKHFTLHVYLDDPRMRVLTYAACDEIAGTMIMANLALFDVASGSHRTRIARAELCSDHLNDFDREPSPKGGEEQSQRQLQKHAGTLPDSTQRQEQFETDDDSTLKR